MCYFYKGNLPIRYYIKSDFIIIIIVTIIAIIYYFLEKEDMTIINYYL